MKYRASPSTVPKASHVSSHLIVTQIFGRWEPGWYWGTPELEPGIQMV